MKQIFAVRLKELRKENKLTQSALSKALKIDIRLYQYYESAKSSIKPTYPTLINIAQYYNVSIDYLVGTSSDKSILH